MYILDAATNLVNINTFFFTIGTCCATIFTTVYLANRKMRREITEKNEKQLGKKADKEYVDQQDRGLHKRVNELRADNDKLDEKIGAMSEDVAWIRGFLDPNKK